VLFKEWIARFETKMKAASQKLVTLVTNYKKDPKLLELDENDEPDRGKSPARAGGRSSRV
jgi:hypothetical protein